MKKFLFFFLLLNFLILPLTQVLAQELKYPPVPKLFPPTKATELPQYIKYLFNFSLMIGGVIALVVLVWAGFLYLTSASNPAKRSEAKRKMGEALFGLLLLLCIYLILVTINPQLVILPGNIISPPPVVTSSPPIPPLPTKTFEEIPLGTLIENLLGEGISCFSIPTSATSALVSCSTGYFLAPSSSAVFSPTTSFYFCYDYDAPATPTLASRSTIFFGPPVSVATGTWINWTGNKIALLTSHDRLDCIKRLLNAIYIKSAQLEDLVMKLEKAMSELEDKTEELKNLAHNCKCSFCHQGFCCGGCAGPCGGGSCTCGNGPNCEGCCNKAIDPCPNRAQMNKLRENIIPPIIEEIEKLRIEICSLIYGASSTQCATTYTIWSPDDWGLDGSTTIDHYPQPTLSNGTLLSTWDVKANPMFLTIQEALDRLDGFIMAWGRDLSNLDSARKKMEDPYGDRLTLMEFYREKHKAKRKYITKISGFVDFFGNPIPIDRYCYKFECQTSTPEGLCVGCRPNSASSVCAIFSTVPTTTLYYLYDGDPATFYLHSDNLKERFVGQKVKIKHNIDVEKGEAGFIKSLIPIGETADEAQEFGELIKDTLEDIYNKLNDAKIEALSARDEAGFAVQAAWNLIDMTSQGNDNSEDCVNTCVLGVCIANCVWYDSVCCSCCNPGPDSSCSPKYINLYHCGSCFGNICPFGIIDAETFAIDKYEDNVRNSLNQISADVTSILNNTLRFNNLISATNLLPGDPNRCTILHKLAISRERLKECITGYGISYKKLATEKRVISCEMTLDLTQTGIIALSPLFPYPSSSTCLNCYPYNSNKLLPGQKQECLNNRFTNICESAIHDLTNNFYCIQKAQQ